MSYYGKGTIKSFWASTGCCNERTICAGSYLQDLMADVKTKGKKQVYILKPDAGCQGRGIRLVQVRMAFGTRTVAAQLNHVGRETFVWVGVNRGPATRHLPACMMQQGGHECGQRP